MKFRAVIFAIAAVVISLPACGQEAKAPPQAVPPPQSYVPIVIELSDYQTFTQWLGEQPTKFGAPVEQWLNVLEQKAQEKTKPPAPHPAPPALAPAPAPSADSNPPANK